MTSVPLETIPCTLCGGAGFDVICSGREVAVHREFLHQFHRRRLKPDAPDSALADRSDFTQDYSTDIVACRSCGLVFRNPRPTSEAIGRMYARDEYGRERMESMFESQAELYRPKAKRLSRRLPPGARVLEVGSFVGGFLRAGRERGWDVLGVDPGEEVREFCASKGLPVLPGMLEDVDLPGGTVDAVFVWNTFDQIPDPDPTLRAASRLLRPGGLFAVRVPNGECFRWGTVWLHKAHRSHGLPKALLGPLLSLMAWNNLLAFPYLYGYSPQTLDRMFSNYHLHQRCIRTDTLCRLSDDQTRTWGVWEERSTKLLLRAASRIQSLHRRSSLYLSPWLDAYYTLGA